MLGVDCECGKTVEFIAQEKTKSPIEQGCDGCDRVYKLTVTAVRKP